MSEAQAIEMLSGHQDFDRFIEEYRRMGAHRPDLVQALILTRERRSIRSTREGSLSGRRELYYPGELSAPQKMIARQPRQRGPRAVME